MHRAVDTTATAQLAVGSGHDGLDVLMGDVTPYHGDLYARMLPDSSFLRSLVAYQSCLRPGPADRDQDPLLTSAAGEPSVAFAPAAGS